MTANQIAYQRNLIEQARNAEIERSNWARETETNRSNLAKETETKRSNRVNEILSGINVGGNLYKTISEAKRRGMDQLAHFIPMIVGA